MMDRQIRGWIVDVLGQRRDLLAVAVRQRAKFEGWLKFELALHAIRQGASAVQVETASELTRGMTLMDRRGRSGLPANCRVLLEVDAKGFFDLLGRLLAKLPWGHPQARSLDFARGGRVSSAPPRRSGGRR